MQAILCLKFWNMTKSGGQFTLAFPYSKFWGTRPPSTRDFRPCRRCKRRCRPVALSVRPTAYQFSQLHLSDSGKHSSWQASQVCTMTTSRSRPELNVFIHREKSGSNKKMKKKRNKTELSRNAYRNKKKQSRLYKLSVVVWFPIFQRYCLKSAKFERKFADHKNLHRYCGICAIKFY